MILALLQWLIANLFMLGVTALVWRHLRVTDRRLGPLIFGFLFLYLTTLLLMLLGLAGLLLRPVLFWISLAGCTTLGWLWATGNAFGGEARRSELLRNLRAWSAAVRPRTRLQRVIALFFAGVVVLQLVRMAVHIWYLPPYVFDTLTYHLPNVAEWVQRGRLAVFDTPVERSYWPANYELFQTWFVLFPHHDIFVDVSSIPFYILATACVYVIARAVGLTRVLSAFAALLYAYTPSVALHATTGNNDLPIAFAYLFMLALITSWRSAPARESGRYALLVVMSFCLALGTKPYIVFLLPGGAVFVLWAILGRRSAWRVRSQPAA